MSALHFIRHSALCLIVFFLTAPALADYTTPGTGVDWTMDDLVANSAGAVTGTGGAYEVLASVFVAQTDRLEIAAGSTLTFVDTTGDIGLEINGILSAIGTIQDPILFTGSVATPGSWRGLDYRDAVAGSDFHLQFCEISYADEGLDIFGADATVWYSEIHHCLSKALDISSGNGNFHTIYFHDNQQRTVTMTLSSSPNIANCNFENNNVENSSPYPYINIGLQGTNSPYIHGNTIIGSGNQMSGGISVWALSEAEISSNRIEGCGYGILCYSTGANPTIYGNEIIDNNIHPDQLNWGFGIACNGNNAPTVGHNLITGHWYGVAVINGGQPDLGDFAGGDPFLTGGNRIYDNGLGGQVYGLYNNTPLPQMAQGNWWGGPLRTGRGRCHLPPARRSDPGPGRLFRVVDRGRVGRERRHADAPAQCRDGLSQSVQSEGEGELQPGGRRRGQGHGDGCGRTPGSQAARWGARFRPADLRVGRPGRAGSPPVQWSVFLS